MNSVFVLLNQGWVGTLLGVLGIGFAVYQIFKRSEAKPVFQYSGQKLISSNGGLLPNEVTVQFHGTTVPRISLTSIVFWNHGQATIKGGDVSDKYPLTFSFEGGQILKVEVVKVTRAAIEASASVLTNDASRLRVAFSFLDAGDGFVLKILHTGEGTKPTFSGTIVGVPLGVKSLGRVTNYQPRKGSKFVENVLLNLLKPSWPTIFAFALVGAGGIIGAVYPDFLLQFAEKRDLETNAVRVAMGIIGTLYLFMGAYIWMRFRRRFPSSINIDES
ncbi:MULTISPECIES: hypothetical protein [Rhizobium/Agrobacterium group]|uniref:hypothetical protein n=1 Tax=Rhizobium/Agrobacterium group TaxID=227290 RepID=UPI00061874CF|nr:MULTISPECIES: hypothetical protein [Rhizobium/Agrobacterium group]AKC09394.1 hypothetical protein Ach5_36210 [Agrobacterium tumefaciens]AYM18537.1 hypothetical protein At15955_35520 [Agrobacterium tumefaciens]AYM69836.1 hypothetical protein AtA6_36200 [Agrobacterium tumefaciens]NIB56333.1 hypothetical protein [Agrobacterium tumefaciens]NSZ23868.1 hypothetical protein [Agrobacterium tumefaciens]